MLKQNKKSAAQNEFEYTTKESVEDKGSKKTQKKQQKSEGLQSQENNLKQTNKKNTTSQPKKQLGNKKQEKTDIEVKQSQEDQPDEQHQLTEYTWTEFDAARYLGYFLNRNSPILYDQPLLLKFHSLRTLPFQMIFKEKASERRPQRWMLTSLKQYVIQDTETSAGPLDFVSTSVSTAQQFLLRFRRFVDVPLKRVKDLPIYTKINLEVSEQQEQTENQETQAKQESPAAAPPTITHNNYDESSYSDYSSKDELYQETKSKKELAIVKKQAKSHDLTDLYATQSLPYNATHSFIGYINVEVMTRYSKILELEQWRRSCAKIIAQQCMQRLRELQSCWDRRKLNHSYLAMAFGRVQGLRAFLVDSGKQLKQIQNDGQRQQFYGRMRKQKVDYYLAKTREMCDKISAKLRELQGVGVPYLLTLGTSNMRQYQLEGMRYLLACTKLNYNCILADDLGLGKTLQAIALLAQLAVEGIHGPHLLIVPSSLLFSWEQEIHKWAPFFHLCVYYGSKVERDKLRQRWSYEDHSSVILTSYNVAVIDQSFLKRKNFYYIICDEAHAIRNTKSRAWNVLMDLKAKHKLLITGTPISNYTADIWSLLHFVLPGLFSSKTEFLTLFARDIERMADGELAVNRKVIKQIHALLRPFMLRRLKSEVEAQLPEKKEYLVPCPLSRQQLYLYTEFINSLDTSKDVAASRYLSVVAVLTNLRRVCNHPRLIENQQIKLSFVLQETVFGFGTPEKYKALTCQTTDFEFRVAQRFKLIYKLLLMVIGAPEQLKQAENNQTPFQQPNNLKVQGKSKLKKVQSDIQVTTNLNDVNELHSAMRYFENTFLVHYPRLQAEYRKKYVYTCGECGKKHIVIPKYMHSIHNRVKCSSAGPVPFEQHAGCSRITKSLEHDLVELQLLQKRQFKQLIMITPKQRLDYEFTTESSYFVALHHYILNVSSFKYQYIDCSYDSTKMLTKSNNDIKQHKQTIQRLESIIFQSLNGLRYQQIHNNVPDIYFTNNFKLYYQILNEPNISVVSQLFNINSIELTRNVYTFNNGGIQDAFKLRGDAFGFRQNSSHSYIYDDICIEILQQFQELVDDELNYMVQTGHAYQDSLTSLLANLQQKTTKNIPLYIKYFKNMLVYMLNRPLYDNNLHNAVYDPMIHGRHQMLSYHTYSHYLGSSLTDKSCYKSLGLFNLWEKFSIIHLLHLLNFYMEPVVLNYQILTGYDPMPISGMRHSNLVIDFYLRSQTRKQQMQLVESFKIPYPNEFFYQECKIRAMSIANNIKLMKLMKTNQFYNVDNNLYYFLQVIKQRQLDQQLSPQDLENIGFFDPQSLLIHENDEDHKQWLMQRQYKQVQDMFSPYIPKQLIPDLNAVILDIDNSDLIDKSTMFYVNRNAFSSVSSYNITDKIRAIRDQVSVQAGFNIVPLTQNDEQQSIQDKQISIGNISVGQSLGIGGSIVVNSGTENAAQNDQQNLRYKHKALVKQFRRPQLTSQQINTYSMAPILAFCIPKLGILSQVPVPINDQVLYRNPRPFLPSFIGKQCQASQLLDSYHNYNTIGYNMHQFQIQKRFSPFASMISPEQLYYTQETSTQNEMKDFTQFISTCPANIFNQKNFWEQNKLFLNNKINRQIQQEDSTALIQQSGKLIVLQKLLQKLYDEKSRVLLFTQQHKMLDILETFLSQQNYQFFRMDGATKPQKRMDLVNRFNTNPHIFAFIMTTRTGGIGLNLTGANAVVFIDTDWNPQIHQQATDRVHRINQVRPVSVFTLVSEYTCEENIVRRATQKKHLDKLIMTDGVFVPEYFDRRSGFGAKLLERFRDQERRLNLVYVSLVDQAGARARLGDVLDAYQDDDDADASAQLLREWQGDIDGLDEPAGETEEPSFSHTSSQIIQQIRIYNDLMRTPPVLFKFFEEGFRAVAPWQPTQVDLDSQVYGFGEQQLAEIGRGEMMEELARQFIVHPVDEAQYRAQLADLDRYTKTELKDDVRIMERARRRPPSTSKHLYVRTIFMRWQ